VEYGSELVLNGAERPEACSPHSNCAKCYTCSDTTAKSAMPTPACPHKRTQLIAKDKDAQYIECLDCGEILETGEMEKKEAAGFDESLSDA
jgi:hypothetical protein